MCTTVRSSLLVVVVASWAVAAPGLKDPPKKEMPSIVGEWIRVDPGVETHRTFTADGKCYWGTKIPLQFESFTVNVKLDPAEIDVTASKAKDPIRGIYKIDGDTLTICRSRTRGGDRPTKFEASDKPPVVIETYKRVKPKD